MDRPESLSESLLPLSDAIVSWARNREDIGNIVGLANTIGVDTAHFRVMLSRGRFPESVLQQFVRLGFIGSRQELDTNYCFELGRSRITTKKLERTLEEIKLVSNILAREDAEALEVLQKVLQKEQTRTLEQIYACTLSHQIEGDPQETMKNHQPSTGIAIFPIEEGSMPRGGLHLGPTIDHLHHVKPFIVDALLNDIHIHCHFLPEAEPIEVAKQEIETLMHQYRNHLQDTVRSSAVNTHLQAFCHFSKRNIVPNHGWIQLDHNAHIQGWMYYDVLPDLRSSLQNIKDPWKYTSIAVAGSRKKWEPILQQIGYVLDSSQGFSFHPNESREQYAFTPAETNSEQI